MSTHTVLNVDDKAANRYLKTRVLRSAGFQVIEAGTGRSALEFCFARRPDLVLLDLKLPDISGFEVCRILKSDPKTRHIPVVHISATFVGEQTKVDSAQAGADVYLAEPVGPQELTSTVRTVMRLRATERTLAQSEARLRLATEGAGIATWDLPAGPQPAVWSGHFHAMLGLDPARSAACLDTWIARVRAGERDAVAQSLRAALERPGSFALEHWIVRADTGEERCLAVFGTLRLEEDGTPGQLIGVAMDVTERKRAEAEREALLQQARTAQKAAEDAARMKDEFLAILSHELRTPMAAVLGWLHLARSGRLPAAEHDKALAVVERNARLQVQLVNDLLDVSRIITGKLELEEQVVALDEALREALETARLSAESRGIALQARIAAGRWRVLGSATRLAQVFGNLLSNALKFSEERSRVEVVLERDGDYAVVTVSDQGEGISADMLPHLFESFRQADSSTRRRHGGLGLGLAIVKSLVEAHRGHIAAESAGRGQGAKFTVALPLLEDCEEREGRQGVDVPGSVQGLRILVVEDEPDHRELVEYLMRARGALVRSAADAEDALRVVKDWRPDVLVLDIAMPQVDGYELLAKLRASLHASADVLPAVALTGLASGADALRAAQAGFQAHQAKPFREDELVRTISRAAALRTGSAD